MTEPKRKVGRPRKVVEETNPDSTLATKEYVKCIGRTYHTKQTQYILDHRKESNVIQMIAWMCIALGTGIWFTVSGGCNPSMIAFIVSVAFVINGIMQVGGYSDTINNSERKGIGFLKEAYCCEKKKKDCE